MQLLICEQPREDRGLKKDGFEAKRVYCSCRELKFGSQHPYQEVHNCLWDPAPSSGLRGHPHICAHTHTLAHTKTHN